MLKTSDIVLLLSLGITLWVLGTIYYAITGPKVLETSALRYWIEFATAPIVSGAICAAVLWWRQVPVASWASAMLLLALPGMIGEAVVLSRLTTFMPRIHPASAGKYGAFLFATYAVVLALAEVVTLKSR